MDLLPDEVFEIICGYLSTSDLLQVTLVSHYTKWIIENSPELMRKLPIYIHDNDPDEMCDVEFEESNNRLIEPLLTSDKKVRKVIVQLKHEKIMKYFSIFKKFGDSIRCLDIRNYAFENLDQLRIILRYVTKIDELTLTNVSFVKNENEILNSIVRMPKLNLENLQILHIESCDMKIFSLFVNNLNIQLREIRLQLNVGENDVTLDDFIVTVNHQRQLTKLTLDGISTELNEHIFHQLSSSEIRLLNLEIKNCKIEQRESARDFIELIKSQKYLKSLKIINSPFPTVVDSIFMYRNIFSNQIMKATLDINENTMIHSHKFVNRSIKRLTLRGNFAFETLPIFVNLIKMFPYVRNLKLEGQSPINEKYLLNILSTFRYLEDLHVPGFTSRTGDSNFSNLHAIDSRLKNLTLEYIDYDVKFFGWKNIVTNLTSIEKLIIKRDYGKVSNEIVEMIVKKLKLYHLELGIGVVSESILKTITQSHHCNHLKVLKIAKCDFDKISKKSINFDKIIGHNQLLFYL